MFSSKTLEQRNNDPYPLRSAEGVRYKNIEGRSGTFSPRPASPLGRPYQHGHLPANPLLLDVRIHLDFNEPEQVYADWLRYTSDTNPSQWDESVTLAQILHAHRVLTLLASLGEK